MNDRKDLFGKKDDANKERYDLVPAKALQEVVHVYTTGSKRYGDKNWEKGLQFSRMYAAAMRHLQAWWMGEDFDTEQTTNRHLASVAWYCLGLMHFEMTNRKDLDDRPRDIKMIKADATCKLGVLATELQKSKYSDLTAIEAALILNAKPMEEDLIQLIKKLEEENKRMRLQLEKYSANPLA